MHIKKLSLNLSISAVQPPELKIPLLFHYFSLFSIFCHCSPPVRQASPAHPWPRQPSLRRQLALYGSLSGQPIDPAFDMLLRLPGRCPAHRDCRQYSLGLHIMVFYSINPYMESSFYSGHRFRSACRKMLPTISGEPSLISPPQQSGTARGQPFYLILGQTLGYIAVKHHVRPISLEIPSVRDSAQSVLC